MKYDEVPQNYHSPYMKQVAEKLSILKMTPEERSNYSYYQKKLYNDRDELQAAEARGKKEGVAEGEARGEEKKAIAMAKKMLLKNKSIDEIVEFTDLTKEQIEKLKSS